MSIGYIECEVNVDIVVVGEFALIEKPVNARILI